jgi:DNA topoisomerase-1
VTSPTGTKLVIVESPTKAKTIANYLGPGFVVESSIGHIRDLPRNAGDVPAALKGQSWARLGIEVDNDFRAHYVVPADKKAQVSKLKALLKDADELYLATDEDREGEAIAWHLLDVLNPRVPVRRMVFHEITPEAIARAANEPRELDMDLVHAQETRRLLDRLYGYEVSPVLWKKVLPKLSAGRVQSVATRIIVERERERIRFVPAGWWGVDVTGETRRPVDPDDPGAPRTLNASLVGLDGVRVASGRDFGEDGALKAGAEVVVVQEDRARALATALAEAPLTVTSVETRPYRRSPYPPFMTSTLQQEAGRKLRFSSQRTMQIAQRLYERGYITYMRTDSTTLSETAVAAARDAARTLYGDPYVPDAPRQYTRKVKNAQEAHEAIRPSGDSFRTPGQLASSLETDERRLYELIWQRTVASQMTDARGTSASIRLAGTADGSAVELAASGKVITFPGFLRAYVEGADDPDAELEDRERRLPVLEQGDVLDARGAEPKGHETQPPGRYTEASLVRQLEELGIGRPSTYASIIQTIQDRGYVWKKGTALVPSWTAFAVVNLLERYFTRLVDYGFTASLEDDLDAIAAGTEGSVAWLTRFYFGPDGPRGPGGEGGAATANGSGPDGSGPGPVSDSAGLKHLVADRLGEIDAREVNSIPLRAAPDGQPLIVRVGRYGPYVQHGTDADAAKASVPEDLPPDELTPEKALELLAAPSGDRVLGTDPATGRQIIARAGRYGPYVTEVLDEDDPTVKKGDKPHTGSLFKSMDLDTVTLEDALRLLTLPRVLGTGADGAEITAQNGRYGPYVKRGTDSRSIESEEQLLTITLEDALAILAQPKLRGGRGAAAPPLRELNANDPVSGKPMVIKDGRFGPYVTDGESNASLRKGDAVESLTVERAAELLADRRARGPAPKKAPRKAAAAKSSARKAPAKKSAKAGTTVKTTAKKATAKKTTAKKTTAKKIPAKKAAATVAAPIATVPTRVPTDASVSAGQS